MSQTAVEQPNQQSNVESPTKRLTLPPIRQKNTSKISPEVFLPENHLAKTSTLEPYQALAASSPVAEVSESPNEVAIPVYHSTQKGDEVEEEMNTPAESKELVIDRHVKRDPIRKVSSKDEEQKPKRPIDNLIERLQRIRLPKLAIITKMKKVYSNIEPIINVVLNFASIVSQCLTLYQFWSDKQYYYFGCMLGFVCIGFLVITYILTKRLKWLGFFLSVSHLDLIYLEWQTIQNNEKEPDSPKAIFDQKTKRYRQGTILFAQTIPCLFITTHSIFVQHITTVITHLSFCIGIINISKANLSFFENRSLRKKAFLLLVFYAGLSANLTKVIFWGFFANFARPYGVWVLSGSLAVCCCILDLILIKRKVRNDMKKNYVRNLVLNAFSIVFTGVIQIVHGKDRQLKRFFITSSIVKLLEITLYIILLGVYHSTLRLLLHETVWITYLVVGVVSIIPSVGLYVIILLVCL